MEIRICKDPSELGKSAAGYVAGILNECIEKRKRKNSAFHRSVTV